MPSVSTSSEDYVITAAEAARAAQITYRQLDHWARQGWVTPSVRTGQGRGSRRLYSSADVLRLAALRHFSKSGWQVSELGGLVNAVDVEDAAWLVAGTQSGVFACLDDNALHEQITSEGQFSVLALGSLRASLAESRTPSGVEPPGIPFMQRRTA